MLLYVCKTCGRWQDVSIARSLNDAVAALARLMNQQPPEQPGYPCPAGCGLMEHVPSDARIVIRPREIEASVEE